MHSPLKLILPEILAISCQAQAIALQELVDDTSLAVGSEAYAAVLQVYNDAKATSGQGAGLDGVVEEMGLRFARKSRKSKLQAAAL